jgi:uncharacterized membrane protein
MVFNLTHLRIYGRKIISRHFQLVRISYQNLDFHGISRFSAALSSIISMFGGTIQEPIYMEPMNKLMLTLVPELYLQTLRLLMMKTAEKRLIP